MSDLFVYDALPSNKRTIRLIRLHHTSEVHEQPQCTLFDTDLNDDDTCSHEYEALSYTWGSNIKSSTIIVNGKLFKVTTHLYEALQAISRWRDHPESLPQSTATRRYSACNADAALWIDAISINQENVQERGEQVQIMKEIFSNASRIVVWLGLGDRDVDAFMDVMAGREIYLQRESLLYKVVEKVPVAGLDIAKSGLIKLMSNNWFIRTWVVQEVLLARELSFACGDRFVDYERFKHDLNDEHGPILYSQLGVSVSEIMHAIPDIKTRGQLLTSIWYMGPSFVHWPDNLYGVLSMSGGRQASDPRDLVYGLLGVVNYPEGIRPLRVDYSIDESGVIDNLIKWAFGGDMLRHWPATDRPRLLSAMLPNLYAISSIILRRLLREFSRSHVLHFIQRVPRLEFLITRADLINMIEHHDIDIVEPLSDRCILERGLSDSWPQLAVDSLGAAFRNTVDPCGVARVVSRVLHTTRFGLDIAERQRGLYITDALIDQACQVKEHAYSFLLLLQKQCGTTEEERKVSSAMRRCLGLINIGN